MTKLQVYTRQSTDSDMSLDLETILDQFEYQFTINPTINHTDDWRDLVDLSAFGEIYETNYDTADAYICSPAGGYPSVMFVVVEEELD